jgi:putative DNA primase/helicase
MEQVENKDPAPSATGDRAEGIKTENQNTERAGKTEAGRGRKRLAPPPYKELEPWAEPVDGAALLDEIVGCLRTYLALPDGAAEAIALWIFFAHTLECWEAAPRLAFISKGPECGKTTAMTVVSHLVPRPLPTVNITSPVLFRLLEKWRPTFLIDEGDTFMDGNDAMGGILNSGHTRGTAFAWRCHPENLDPERYSTWGPIVIARIGNLPQTLASRSILIRMQRRLPSEKVVRFTRAAEPDLQQLARKASRWGADNSAALVNADSGMPHGLGSRAADNWRPLVAIAVRVGGRWPNVARRIAPLMSQSQSKLSAAEQLLADVRSVFETLGVDRLPSNRLCEELAHLEHRPWRNYGEQEAVSPGQLARLLDQFDITPKVIRIEDSTPRGYTLDQFQDAFARHLPPLLPESATPQQPSVSAVFSHCPTATLAQLVADQAASKPAENLECCGVADPGRGAA